MQLKWFVFALLIGAGPVVAQSVTVPSGIDVALFDVVLEPEPPVARFRFEVPAIAGGALPFADVLDDIQYLCDAVVIPGLAANGWTAGEVVISLSAAQVAFGETAPDVTQYFQPFRIADDACIWEDF